MEQDSAVLLTAAQMRALEAAAIAQGAVTGRALMERAGQGVVAAIAALGGKARPVLVLCGPGNNGGDGYVVARLMAGAGRPVQVFALADPATADARLARADWAGPVRGLEALDLAFPGRPLVVDALFGTGLTRDVAASVWQPLARAQAAGCPIVAVDVPSGICADSGRVRAEGGFLDHPVALTVTFESPRLGHMLEAGGRLSGRLVVADIGLGPWREGWLATDPLDLVRAARPAVAALAKTAGHKYSHGHALILGGGVGQGGAARLAARAALRVGAGLVTLGCPPAALPENAARLDVVMLAPLADGAALRHRLTDRRISALCLGPGLGRGPREVGLVEAALGAGRPAVLDADALTLLAQVPALTEAVHATCVLTPHEGEFARLFPQIATRLSAPLADGPAFSRVDAVRQAAAQAGVAVLLKGHDTVIATPDGRAVVHAALRDRAAPWLATAGSGDVLAGLIAGLLARGLPPLTAAETAVWLHADAALAFGPGLIAEDLPEALPGVLRRLLG